MSLKISNRAVVFSTIEGVITTSVAFAVIMPNHKWASIPFSLLKWFFDFLIGYTLSAYVSKYGIEARFYRQCAKCGKEPTGDPLSDDGPCERDGLRFCSSYCSMTHKVSK